MITEIQRGIHGLKIWLRGEVAKSVFPFPLPPVFPLPPLGAWLAVEMLARLVPDPDAAKREEPPTGESH